MNHRVLLKAWIGHVLLMFSYKGYTDGVHIGLMLVYFKWGGWYAYVFYSFQNVDLVAFMQGCLLMLLLL